MSERSPDPRSAIVSTRPTSPSSARRVVFNRTSSVVVCRAPVEQQRSDDIRRYSLHQGAVPTVGNRPVHSTLTPPPVRSDTAMDPVAIGQPIQQPPHEVMKESGKYEEDSHGLGDTKASRKGSPSKITSEFMLHAPENTSANFEEISNPKLHLSQLDETNLESSQDLAGCYFRGGDLDEAEKLYNDLIKECIRAINYFRYAGKVFRMKLHVAQITWLKGCHRDSEKDFKILNDTVETFRDEVLTCKTAKWLALSQWKQGKYAEAKKTIQDCVDKEPGERNENKALLSTRALILASAGSFRWALRDSIKAIDGRTHGIEQKELPKMQKIICNINHARVLSEIGRYDEATVKNNEALSDLQKSLGPKHLVTLDAASLRAWLLVVNTNTSETGEEVQRTLRQMRERLGENHPSTLQTVQTLVLAYKNDGRYSDAEATARYLVRKCEDSRELGRAHPQTLKSKTILAQVLLAVGTLKEAEECQREVVKDEKTTYFQQVTLANILRESGKWDEARDLAIRMMLEQLHKFSRDEEEDSHTEHDQPKEITGEELAGVQITSIDLEKILLKSQHVRSKLQKLPQGLSDPTAGPHPVRVYPSLIQTMQCVALCEQVRDDANLAFAEALLKKIHEICVQKLGTSHQFTTTVEHDLAVNHRLSGKFLQARRVIDRVIEQRRSTLGTDHPDYLLSRHQRSVVLLRLSRWQEALKEQEFVLRAQHFLLGTRHPMTVLSRYTLAGIYHSLNRFEEADDLLLKVIIDQREVYNPTRTDLADHAIVIRTRARFALVRLDRALFTSAKSEQKSVVEHRTKHLGKNHHLTQSSLNDLAQIEQASGNKTEAEKIYKSLLIIMDGQDPNPMEKSHENILAFQVQSNLATCYYEKGLYEKAKGLQGDLYKELAGRQETDDRFVASAFNLALTCKALRESQYACNLLRETVQASQRRLGDEHPQTQELKATLTEWNKQYANSESLDRTEDWRRSNA
jgi:tetratricopeptide (TPR) repeat protein